MGGMLIVNMFVVGPYFISIDLKCDCERLVIDILALPLFSVCSSSCGAAASAYAPDSTLTTALPLALCHNDVIHQ